MSSATGSQKQTSKSSSSSSSRKQSNKKNQSKKGKEKNVSNQPNPNNKKNTTNTNTNTSSSATTTTTAAAANTKKKNNANDKAEISGKPKSANEKVDSTTNAQNEQDAAQQARLENIFKQRVSDIIQAKSTGLQYMQQGDFERAKIMFEDALRGNIQLPDSLETRSHLLLCRLNCENVEQSLVDGLTDCNILLQYYIDNATQANPTATTTSTTATTAATDTSASTSSSTATIEPKDGHDASNTETKLPESSGPVETKVEQESKVPPPSESVKTEAPVDKNVELEKNTTKQTEAGQDENTTKKAEEEEEEDDEMRKKAPIFSPCRLWLVQAELNLRLNRFKEAAECVLKATECDQPPHVLPSVYKYLHHLKKNTEPSEGLENESKMDLLGVESEKLERFFAELTVMSQQLLFSISWEKIHESIESPLCQEMLPKNLSQTEKTNVTKFLHQLLDWNLPSVVSKARARVVKQMRIKRGELGETNKEETTDTKTEKGASTSLQKTDAESDDEINPQLLSLEEQDALQQKQIAQSLVFLKAVCGYLCAREMWKHFPMPPEPPADTLSLEDALPVDTEPTYFLEAGLFACENGYDFMSGAVYEPSFSMATFLEVTRRKPAHLLLSPAWLHPSGYRMVHWLANVPSCFGKYLADTSSEASQCSEKRWNQFFDLRIEAHFESDPDTVEALITKEMSDAHDDTKKFEEAMERIVGKEKKNQLMQLELDLSIPILKKYAQIMSVISGIDEDKILYELALPEDEPHLKERHEKRKDKGSDEKKDENTPTITMKVLSQYLNNKDFKDYKPVGLLGLIQSSHFDVIPTNGVSNTSDPTKAKPRYDRNEIAKGLKELEKEVIQFQIDYKAKVAEVAGDKLKEIEDEMKALQYRGLELTRWLRAFVKKMIARRELEQDIVDVSGKNGYEESFEWFKKMTNYVHGASDLLLRLIARILMYNLLQAYVRYDDPNAFKEAKQQHHGLLKQKEQEWKKIQQELKKKEAESQAANTTNPSATEPTRTDNTNETKTEESKDKSDTSAVQMMIDEEEKEKEANKKRQTELEKLRRELGFPNLHSWITLGKKIEKVDSRYFELHRLATFYAHVREAYVYDPSTLNSNAELADTNDNNTNNNDTTGNPPKKSMLKAAFGALRKQHGGPAKMVQTRPTLQETIVASVDQVEKVFKERIMQSAAVRNELEFVKNKLDIRVILVPVLEMPIPTAEIENILQGKQTSLWWYDSPIGKSYAHEIKNFYQRCRHSKEVIFCLVYSSTDRKVIPVYSTYTQPNKFYACSNCEKIFSSLRCGDCGMTHYCSKECQVSHWRYHKLECKRLKEMGQPTVTFML